MLNKDSQIKELIKLNDELENYFRNTIIPQLFVDADLILRKFTPPAMKQFRFSADDLGKSITDIQDNVRFPSIVENIQQVIDTHEILEKEVQTKDLRWYQMNIIPYKVLEENKANGVIITFVEITARIKDLKEQEKLIAEHETLLDTISHDLKNPLTNLVLTVSFVKKLGLESAPKVQSLFGSLEKSILKMQSIIHDLTDTRKRKYKYETEEELLNFEHILEDVRLTIAENINESGAIIKSEINVSEVLYSRRKLRSILYNLVSNAIKFKSAHHPPEIFVKTEQEGDFTIITVKDNGIGIDARKHEVIFSKYFRMQNEIEGSGIGLYLVNEIVNSSGGKILLKSEPGKGSEFKVYLKTVEELVPMELS
jgi:two-component system phosphate regulon sensor histidine kinase PhoR